MPRGYAHAVTSGDTPAPVTTTYDSGQSVVAPSVSKQNVLTIEAVRRAIEALHKPFIHEQFIAYLHLRERGVTAGSMTSIEPSWMVTVSKLLGVPGGGPARPHYLPIASRKKKDPAGYWMNPNIPGSYAPKSLRKASQFMLNATGDGFDLPPDHAAQALSSHLGGARQPAWMFAAFLLRNYGFDPSASTAADLIDGFRAVFRFDTTGPGTDFDTLFTVGNEPEITWFETLPEPAGAIAIEADD